MLAIQDGRLASDDWDRFVTLVRERRTDTPPLSLTRSQGAYPDAAQRRALMEAIGPALHPHARIAVLTDSVVGRAAVTAMAWITPGFRAFRSEDTAGALHYLGVTGAAAADMERALVALESELDLRVNAS